MATSYDEIQGKPDPAHPVSGFPEYKAGVLLAWLHR